MLKGCQLPCAGQVRVPVTLYVCHPLRQYQSRPHWKCSEIGAVKAQTGHSHTRERNPVAQYLCLCLEMKFSQG